MKLFKLSSNTFNLIHNSFQTKRLASTFIHVYFQIKKKIEGKLSRQGVTTKSNKNLQLNVSLTFRSLPLNKNGGSIFWHLKDYDRNWFYMSIREAVESVNYILLLSTIRWSTFQLRGYYLVCGGDKIKFWLNNSI